MTSDAAVPQWSDEAVAEAFRAEIRSRLAAHNAAYRVRSAAELEQVFRDHPEHRGQPGFEVCDSGAWEIYQASEIRMARNEVTIVLPTFCAIGIDLVQLFDHTTMAWTRAAIGAVIVDGEPRVAIKILLVATWTDAMDVKWRGDGNARRQVLVELFEDEVCALDALVFAHRAPDEATKALRDKLALALDPFP